MAQFIVTVPDAAVPRIRAAVAIALQKNVAAVTTADVQEICRRALRALCLQTEQQGRAAVVATDSEAAVAADFPA